MNNEDINVSSLNTDSVVFSIIKQFKKRADFGMMKYGTNMDRTDLNMLDWIQHAQEEHMDAIIYLEKMKKMEIQRQNGLTTYTRKITDFFGYV